MFLPIVALRKLLIRNAVIQEKKLIFSGCKKYTENSHLKSKKIDEIPSVKLHAIYS